MIVEGVAAVRFGRLERRGVLLGLSGPRLVVLGVGVTTPGVEGTGMDGEGTIVPGIIGEPGIIGLPGITVPGTPGVAQPGPAGAEITGALATGAGL